MTKHGYRPKGKKERLYNIWLHMRERCLSKTHIHYKNYGGRSITICEEWHDYLAFRNWSLTNGYKDNLTLDRIDNDGNYEPSNCRWVTMKEQGNNRRSNHLLTLNGATHNIETWSKIIGLPRTTIEGRLSRGWSIEKTLTTPLLIKKGGIT